MRPQLTHGGGFGGRYQEISHLNYIAMVILLTGLALIWIDSMNDHEWYDPMMATGIILAVVGSIIMAASN